MNEEKIRLFNLTTPNKFAIEDLPVIDERLKTLPDSQYVYLQSIEFKDPNTALAISFFAGIWGIDRFYVEDVALGILKLITCGGCCIWWLIDLVYIKRRTQKYNLKKISALL